MKQLCAIILALSLPAPSLALADDLTFLAHEPVEKSAHPPLIILMHGVGASESDMIGLWHDLPGTFVVISPRAPFPNPGGGYSWYRKAGANPIPADLEVSRKVVDLLIDNAVKRYDADPRRIFIGGFSQGAVMTYEVALREPGRFRGAAVLSGIIFASEASALSAKTDRSHEAFFVAHGTIDNRIPFTAATAAKATLATLGVPTAFHAYQGMGHTIGPEETRDFSAWLRERSGG